MDQVNVYQILTDLGYKLKDFGKEYRAKPLYRDSDNDTVLKIYKDTGHWFDFKENISGDFSSLVGMTLKLEDPNKAKEWLKDKNFAFHQPKEISKPLLKSTKKFDLDLLSNLENDNSYWNKRGINNETLDQFKGGVGKAGKMKNRYVFPIFDIKNNIIGFSGRDITNLSKIKWKHLGEKSDFLYPLFLNSEAIQSQKEIILVESIGDMLSLYQAGIKNILVTFGTSLSLGILNYLLRIDIKKIYISLNNDSNKNNAGNIGAEKTHSRLKRYFDDKQLKIALPTKKDFGEMNKEEILQWKNNL
ncbi:MAG: toprim domain-containing protein [Caulobacteraceae bacterium]|nr:toprim domain-containing protein [Caulobacteraceae bacterium]